ncbi:MAG: serine/threonine protein kinase, partial [Gammaproteobacteria bacterium]|nr:serine/threonine protein kinase [Gammaproteobacteria bacterium]
MSNRALTPGHRLGPFDIEGVLGAGSFGITYRAHDRNLHRSVAIKEFFPRAYAARDPDRVTVNPQSEGHARGYRGGLNLFLNEARVLAKYRHPSIVRVSQLFRANNTAYIVMDYEKGATLSAVLKRTTHFTTRRIVELARELLSGLSKLHEAGVIHCDIAPRNIILRDDGSYVLIDFGAVRTLWDAEVTAGSGNRYTPAYAPPELWFTGAPTGPWSDIFCLGAVLYHCITGEAPLDASRRKRLVDNATRGLDSVHLALAVQKESRPAGLLDTVRWMLALTPERRPQSAGEILAA